MSNSSKSFDDDYPYIQKRVEADDSEYSERMKQFGIEPGPNEPGESNHHTACDTL